MKVLLRSIDVLHDFYVPEFRAKMDMIPGSVTYFWFSPTRTGTFEVLCARLQDKIHDLQKHADPILTLLDASGRELAANDDFYFADPLLTYTFQHDGNYTLQLRDSKYDGDPAGNQLTGRPGTSVATHATRSARWAAEPM